MRNLSQSIKSLGKATAVFSLAAGVFANCACSSNSTLQKPAAEDATGGFLSDGNGNGDSPSTRAMGADAAATSDTGGTLGTGGSAVTGSGGASGTITDGGPRDTITPDGSPRDAALADSGSLCVRNGVTYQPGQFFVLNCVVSICQSDSTWANTGATCGDAGSVGGSGGAGGALSGGAGGSVPSVGGVTGKGGAVDAQTSSTGGNAICNGTTLFANEANDYSFTSTITLPPIKVKPNSELTLDWGAVTADISRHAVDLKTDITLVTVLAWDIPLSLLEYEMNKDTAQSRDLLVVPISYSTDGNATSASLFDFTLSGTVVDPSTILEYFDADAYPPDANTYTLMASIGTKIGEGIKMIQAFQLDPTSTNTTVKMTNDSTQLSFKADLQRLTPTWIPAGQAAITLDWSKMKTNALGNTFVSGKITKALIGHYTQTPAELETNFLDLELIATALYSGTIATTRNTIDFSLLKDAKGNNFAGINETGTWVVALQCASCHNPAPWYLTMLKPCQ
jgi:hypothetical protein